MGVNAVGPIAPLVATLTMQLILVEFGLETFQNCEIELACCS